VLSLASTCDCVSASAKRPFVWCVPGVLGAGILIWSPVPFVKCTSADTKPLFLCGWLCGCRQLWTPYARTLLGNSRHVTRVRTTCLLSLAVRLRSIHLIPEKTDRRCALRLLRKLRFEAPIGLPPARCCRVIAAWGRARMPHRACELGFYKYCGE